MHQEGMGSDDAGIGGPCHGALDGLDAAGNAVGRAHVVGPEEALQGGAAGELRGVERRPAAQDVAKERRIFLVKPVQDMREGVFERTGQAVREADCVTDQAPAVRDEWRQGAPGGALGGERRERVPVCEQERDLKCGIGGVICGPARGKRVTGLRQGERSDGKAHEEIIVAQRGHDGPFIEFQAHGHRVSVAPRMQGADPRVDRCGAVCEGHKLPALGAGGLSADIVCGIRPVEAHKGRKGFRGLWLHVSSPNV